MAGAQALRREVIVSTRLRGADTLEVSVEDTGPGILPNAAEMLFQPFYTTKPQGMGMGLSLSRSIAVAHGGELTVEPDVSTGASFRLTLPIMKEEQHNATRSHRIYRR
jgi:two-component system sensor kinase FixL